MKESKNYRHCCLIALCLYCITLIGVDAAAAQSRGLSRITAQQITKLMQLPQEYATYDAVAECAKANSARCGEMDQNLVKAKMVFTVSDDGNTKTHECAQTRIFRFDRTLRLWLFISLCRDGPLAMPALLDTKTASARFSQSFFDDLSRRNPGANPFSELASQRTIKVNAEETIYIFSLVLLGHGIGFVPTGVVASSQRNDTLVVQFLVIPEDNEIKDSNHPVAKLISKSTETLEALARELSRTTR